MIGFFSVQIAIGILSSLPTCIKLQANCIFETSLYVDKSVPITFATDGIKYLLIFMPIGFVTFNSRLRTLTSLICSPNR